MSLPLEEATAAEIMENAALKRPSIPDETQQEVKVVEGSWLVSQKQVIAGVCVSLILLANNSLNNVRKLFA